MLRNILLTLILFTTLSITQVGHAASESSKSQTVYERATDAQLKDAQDYYDACQESGLNQRKNCKCAATGYLEKRIELGDDASVEEVTKANVNACLVDPDLARVDVDRIDLSMITEAQKREAEGEYKRCKGSRMLSQRFECDCYAARYLDERIKVGPAVAKEQIYEAIAFDCKNLVEQVGIQYTECTNTAKLLGTGGRTLGEYCECYARRWVKLFKAHEGVRNYATAKGMSTNAHEYCRNTHEYDE